MPGIAIGLHGGCGTLERDSPIIGAGLVAAFNPLGMARGWITTEGELTVATHRELHAMGQA